MKLRGSTTVDLALPAALAEQPGDVRAGESGAEDHDSRHRAQLRARPGAATGAASGRPCTLRPMSGTSSERTVYAWQTSIGVAVVGTAAAVALIVVFTYMDDYIGSFWSQLIYFAAFFGVVIGLAERSRRLRPGEPVAARRRIPAGDAGGPAGAVRVHPGVRRARGRDDRRRGADRRRRGVIWIFSGHRARAGRRRRAGLLGRHDDVAAKRGQTAVIRAAGGVLRRDGKIAIVHRPRRGDWSLPKGKLEAGRGRCRRGLREVLEETGHRAVDRARPGHGQLRGLRRHPKDRALLRDGAEGAAAELADDVDEVVWLAPEARGGL